MSGLRGAGRRRVPPLDGPERDGVDAACQVGAPREQPTALPRHRANPLPRRDVRKHAVDPPGRGRRHPAAAAPRAEAAALAGEGHQAVVVAARAVQPLIAHEQPHEAHLPEAGRGHFNSRPALDERLQAHHMVVAEPVRVVVEAIPESAAVGMHSSRVARMHPQGTVAPVVHDDIPTLRAVSDM
jgi:hypothetical protein